jgi:hypothetical protein
VKVYGFPSRATFTALGVFPYRAPASASSTRRAAAMSTEIIYDARVGIDVQKLLPYSRHARLVQNRRHSFEVENFQA